MRNKKALAIVAALLLAVPAGLYAQRWPAVNMALVDAWARIGFRSLNVLHHGALGDDSADDLVAFNSVVAACNASATGGTILVPKGTYRISGEITSITRAGCQLQFDPGVVLKPTGTWAGSLIRFSGPGPGAASVTLSADATRYTNTFTTADASMLSAGGYVVFQKDAPGNVGDVYKFIARVRTITGSGPFTVDLNDAFPITFGTADAGLLVKPWTPIENVGITGGVTCNGSLHTTGQLICVQANNVAYSRFAAIYGTSIGPEAGLLFYAADTSDGYGGYFNTFDDIGGASLNGGTPPPVAVGFLGQTHGTYNNTKAAGGVGTGFGVQWQECSYVTAINTHSVGHSQVAGVGRGIKIQSTVGGSFTNTISNNSGDNGLAIAEGSGDLSFFGVTANDNKTSEGVWFNGTNFNIRMWGVNARGNDQYDIAIQEGDTDIEIWGASFDTYKNRGGAFIQKVGEPPIAPNILVNPAMTHDQANEGTVVALSSGGAATYIADGWQALFRSDGGNTVSCQRAADGPDNFANSIKCTTTGSNAIQAADYLAFRQPIEASFLEGASPAVGANTGKSLCATFWAWSSIANYDITGIIGNYALNRVWVPVVLFNIPTANTWTKFKFCAPSNSGGTWVTSGMDGGAYLVLTGAAGSSGLTSAGWKTSNFYGLAGADTGLLTTTGAVFGVSKVKLEVGYGSTPFQARDPASELKLVERYYEKSYDFGVVPGTVSTSGEEMHSLFGTTNDTYKFPIRYKTPKRCIPSNPGVKVYSPTSGAGGSGINGFVRQTASGDKALASLGQAGYKGIFLSVVLTPLVNDSVVYHWTADCRLP